MRKILCMLKLLRTVIQFKTSNHSQHYWPWLFNQVSNPYSYFYRDWCCIVALFSWAYNENDYYGVCAIYDDFRDQIIQREMLWKSNDMYAKKIMKCAYAVGREDIPKDILAIRSVAKTE